MTMDLDPKDDLLSPQDHPSPQVTMDDYRRALNRMVEATRMLSEKIESFEIRMAANGFAIEGSNFSEGEVKWLLAAAIERIIELT